ncbi:MAG: hypothetical protein CMD14_04120 [Flavobacteriales bacterium]|nr:hypothetical protein [Flavobacteriales bacterium]
MKLKSLMKNKTFLYFVLFIAVVNAFGYLMMREFEAVMLFVLVGFLTTYFSNNMIIVLLTAIVVTNLFASSRLTIKFKEGMEGHKDKKEGEEEKEKDEEEEEEKEGLVPLQPADYPPNGKKSKIDSAGTLEAAYDHLDKLLESDAINKMSDETQKLANQQDKLMKNIDRLEPMLSSAEGMIKKLGILSKDNKNTKEKIEEMTSQLG